MAETFPIGIWNITGHMTNQLYVPMLLDINDSILSCVYAEMNTDTPSYNSSYGSPFHFTIQQHLANQYLHSGLYKSIFTNGLVGDYDTLQMTSMTFQEFADQAYEDFDVETGFYELEAYLYQEWYGAVMELGHTVYTNTDLYDLTTIWMR